ncbi:hypothetical protein EQ836_23855 [Ectopseudomonas mendocina]|uniref:Uncharacterized protein n=1 Tax=Ectopseudomonas mendocina TaxID=300 RepID=A0ABD7RUZ1_ECTME|nr:hypothetical protein EQ829_21950 [Pseudomonas mendocina]TRO11732.1 hypothetical protein EQ836_23855 [Pseudomonas mendocina]
MVSPLTGESLSLACPRESNQREGHPAHTAPAAPGFPRSITAPGARREGPSLAHHGSRDIHVAQPLPRRFHSAS